MLAQFSKILQHLDPYQILFVRLPRLYRHQDKVLHLLALALLLWGLAVRVANLFTYRYPTLWFATQYATAIPGLLLVWLSGVLMRERRPRLGLFISSFSQSFLFVIVIGYALSGAITTPFPIIDHSLFAIDEKIGFSTISVLNWTHQFSWLVSALTFCYSTWFLQLSLTPVLLALFFKDIKAIDTYLIATFISLLIGATIYYCWPTIAPAGILQSPYFLDSQHDLVLRFFQVHHHLPITAVGGGMIAFPSFHVINTLLVLHAWRQHRYVFLPLLLFNVATIFSTLGLGYHYLVDVIGGFVIAYLSIKLTRYYLRP